MTKKACFLFFQVFTFLTIPCAQDLDTYNALYTKTFLETSQQDFPRALHIADSLFIISETPILQAKSLMLTASLYQQKGETIKAIEYALKAEKIINSTNDEDWKTRIYGFLATQYRIARLYTPASEYIEKAMNTAEKIKDPQSADTPKGLIMQEKAYYKMAHKQYREAITYIQQSKRYFENIKQNQEHFAMGNEQLLGLANYHLGEENKALAHYTTALNLSTSMPQNHVTALIHNGLANIYLDRNDLPKAEEHLDIAQRIADQSLFLQLKKEINETAYRYYSSTNDIHQIRAVKKAQDSIVTTIYRQSADFLNNSYTTLGLERENKRRRTKSKFIFIFMGVLIVLPITLYFFLPHANQKHMPAGETKSKSDELTKKENTQDVLSMENKLSPSNIQSDSKSPLVSPMISEDTINKILTRLEEFEKKQLYVKRDVSLSYLATYCDTNSKYLSIVINSYKKKDFFNYINELRINYIVEKLTSEPYYRRLKIAALAREAGFSSQSKFALNFKKVASISPSEFVKSLSDS